MVFDNFDYIHLQRKTPGLREARGLHGSTSISGKKTVDLLDNTELR